MGKRKTPETPWEICFYGPLNKNTIGRDEDCGLLGISRNRLGFESREAKFLITLLLSAAKDRDMLFLFGGPAEAICNLTKLDYHKTMKIFKSIWKCEI